MSTIETVDDFLGALNDMTAKFTAMRKELVRVDQARAELGSLNAEIGVKQEKLHYLNNQIQQLLNKLHLRKEVA